MSHISEVNGERTILSDTPLHLAVETCDTEIVMLLLDKGAKVDAKNKMGRTPLHVASVYGHMEIIKLLLNWFANVNDRDTNGMVPLCIAAQNGHLQIVEELLKHGASINIAYNCDFKEYFLVNKLSGITALHAAVEKGHFQIVAHLLKEGACVNSAYTSKFKKDYTPLHIAVETKNEEIVKLLLKYKANINAGGKVNLTPLHIAAQKECGNIVQLLLESGANVDAKDIGGKTVLYIAAQKGNSTVVDAILRHCPDIDNEINKKSLVSAVCSFGHEYKKIVESLLQYGFTINSDDVNDLQLLQDSVEKGYLQIIKDILKYNSDIVNEYDSKYNKSHTLLHIAAKNNQEQVAQLLISSGSDINAIDEIGKPPIFYATANVDFGMIKLLVTSGYNFKHNPDILHLAVRKKSKEIVELILQHGININTTDNLKRTALHFTAFDLDPKFSLKNDGIKANAEIAKLLLTKGVDVNAETEDGLTTLHLAAKNGYADIVQVLLEYNAQVNICNANNITPSQFSTQKGSNILLDKCVNINAKSKYDETALHFATNKGHKEVVHMLLHYGAKLDVQNKSNKTPLHIAAVLGYQKILKLLLDSGAAIDSRDEDGKTPLHYACENKHKTIISILLEYFSDINIEDRHNYTPFCYIASEINPLDYSIYILPKLDSFTIHVDTMCEKKIIYVNFIKHITKIIIADFYISEKNLQLFYEKGKILEFEAECSKELENMKNHKINDNVSLYDILKNLNALVMYARNEDIINALSADYCNTKFPIYGSWLINLLKRGIVKRDLINGGIKMFYSVFGTFPELPYNCVEKIVNHLSDDDIRVLTGFSLTN